MVFFIVFHIHTYIVTILLSLYRWPIIDDNAKSQTEKKKNYPLLLFMILCSSVRLEVCRSLKYPANHNDVWMENGQSRQLKCRPWNSITRIIRIIRIYGFAFLCDIQKLVMFCRNEIAGSNGVFKNVIWNCIY